MNVTASSLVNTMSLFSSCKIHTGPAHKKRELKEAAALSGEERMIKEFKEEHSPSNEKVSQLYYKFLGGKELSSDEISFLAKNAPDLYKKVKEIMMEREAMEMRMKAAKTKMEVAAVHMNELANIKDTMGTGEQAKRQATKTMARTSQMNSAYMEFTASAEYREKEDEASQAEERRENLRELDAREEEGIQNSKDLEEESQELFQADNQTDGFLNSLQSGEEVSPEDEEKRKDVHSERKKRKKDPPEFLNSMVQVDMEYISKQTRALYRNAGNAETKRSSGVDVSI